MGYWQCLLIGTQYGSGGGARLGRALRLGSRRFDRWAKSVKGDFVWISGVIIFSFHGLIPIIQIFISVLILDKTIYC